MWGTAGTGTAIASLSGAAATNATLACIGGTIGGGMAAGTVIVSGGAILVVFATTYAVYKVFDWLDELNSRRMLSSLIENYKRDDILEKVVKNSSYYKSIWNAQ